LIDVGDPLPIQTMEVRDAAGVLANAGAMALTVTLPDGTSVSPGFSNSATGVYVPNVYVTTQVGRHVVRWVGTGLNAAAYTEAFDVRPALAAGILSLADARAVCNLETSTQDAELRIYIEATTDAIEGYIGPIGRRTVIETVYPSSGVLLLRTTPVLSLTSVTPYLSAALTVGSLVVDLSAGIVYPGTYGGFWAGWYDVVYEAGRVVIPAAVHLAARKTLKHLWSPDQYGAAGLPRAGFGGEDTGLASQAFAFVKSYGVRELLDPYRSAPAVA
jgi:hypothetical protein